MRSFLLNIPLLCFIGLGDASFPYMYPRINLEAKLDGKAGAPLILTPYLKRGAIQEARDLARVPLTDQFGFSSYAGFFTTDERYNSNLYFWYFPPFSKQQNAPVLLWLQGGPGGSSLFGLFTELGPLAATKKGFITRKYHWALNHHLIFIDNPAGTGFSFTRDKDGYCTDEHCIAKGLFSAMSQFFTLFPDLAENDFYITGESYAGKYIPAFATEIHQRNANGVDVFINLKGLAIGNGYSDPINQLDYGSYLYELGLLDERQKDEFEDVQEKIKRAIRAEEWTDANMYMEKLLDGELTSYSLFRNFTGYNNLYNYLFTEDPLDMSIFAHFLENDDLRRSIHVGGLPFNGATAVELALFNDILKSTAYMFKELLSNYRVLIYNGQLDIIVAYPLTENFLQNLEFDSREQYKTAKRKQWMVGKELAGYVKKAGNLTEVLVRNAGHMVPHDQPKWAFDLITRFVWNKL